MNHLVPDPALCLVRCSCLGTEETSSTVLTEAPPSPYRMRQTRGQGDATRGSGSVRPKLASRGQDHNHAIVGTNFWGVLHSQTSWHRKDRLASFRPPFRALRFDQEPPIGTVARQQWRPPELVKCMNPYRWDVGRGVLSRRRILRHRPNTLGPFYGTGILKATTSYSRRQCMVDYILVRDVGEKRRAITCASRPRLNSC